MPKLKRRMFLRGALGTAIALPLLDAMMDDNGEALADGSALPCRYFVGFGGFSLRTDRGVGLADYIPTRAGRDYDLPTALSPLAGHGNVKNHISVVSNLTIPLDANRAPGPGEGRVFHHHAPALLCGVRSEGTDHVDPTFGGSSSDQIVADAIGGTTTFRSLQYRAQAGSYTAYTDKVHKTVMSWRRDAMSSAPATPVQPVVSPRQAYETLFTNFDPSDPAIAARNAFEREKRGTILDLVDRRMNGLAERLGASDRQRIDKHLDEIRAIERSLMTAPPPAMGNPNCMMLPHPGNDPPIGGAIMNGTLDYDVNKGYSNEDRRVDVLSDLIHMAFVCDLSRVATLMYTFFQSNMNCFELTGARWMFHSLHHHGGTTQQLSEMIQWHVDRYAGLVAKMRDTPEGAGSLLDNCALVFLNEGGRGAQYGNDPTEKSHTAEDMACLVAGGAGGLRQGEHIIAPSGRNHPAHVLATAMSAVGAGNTGLGEVSGLMSEMIS